MVARNHLGPALALGLVAAFVSTPSVRSQESAPATPSTGDLTRTFMYCVRNLAARLEPSGDDPEAVAKAAVFLCLPEETDAVNAALREKDNYLVGQLRGTAIFYGSGQVVIARLCRKTKDCLVPPPPASPRTLAR